MQGEAGAADVGGPGRGQEQVRVGHVAGVALDERDGAAEVLLRAAMVDGRTDLGLMSSGQVAGLIDDLPSCAELIESIMAEAGETLGRLAAVRTA